MPLPQRGPTDHVLAVRPHGHLREACRCSRSFSEGGAGTNVVQEGPPYLARNEGKHVDSTQECRPASPVRSVSALEREGRVPVVTPAASSYRHCQGCPLMEERLRKIARREENIRRARDARERLRQRQAAEELQRRQAAAARKLELKYSGREERPGTSSASPPPPSPLERRGDVAKVFLGRLRHEERKKAEELASASESIAQARLEALYGPRAAVAVRPLPTLAWLRRPATPLQQSCGEEATSANATVGLPDEVWLEVLGFLDFDALQACRGVCSHMRRLASDGSLWRPLVSRLYPRAVERLCACSSTVYWVDWAMQCARATPWYALPHNVPRETKADHRRNRKETRSSLALPGTSFGSAPTALACRGLLVAVAMSDCTVTVVELCSEARSSAVAKLSWTLPSTGAVLCMDVSPSGRLLACGLEDGGVQVADIRAQAWVASLAPHAGRVSKVLFLG